MLFFLGDNLRTAVHTASCCGIIQDTQDVIAVSAEPNKTFTDVEVQYQLLAMSVATSSLDIKAETSCLLETPTECFVMEGASYMYLKALRPELLNKVNIPSEWSVTCSVLTCNGWLRTTDLLMTSVAQW